MNRFIVLFIALALVFAMLGCAVNATTGAITAQNLTATATNDVKVGSVYIGYLGAGQTTTVYFSSALNDMQVSATGFSAPAGQKGTIDLKLNHVYNLTLYKSGSTNTFSISGIQVDATAYDTNMK